jgi:hypothetical protein
MPRSGCKNATLSGVNESLCDDSGVVIGVSDERNERMKMVTVRERLMLVECERVTEKSRF